MREGRETRAINCFTLKTSVSHSSWLSADREISFSPPPGAEGIPLSAEGLTRDSSNGDILLSWEKPSPVQARGYIVGYEIRFAEAMEEKEGGGRRRREECPRDQCVLGRGQTSGCCQVGPNTTTATISGLENRKSYEVSVSVVNRAGVGDIQNFTVAGEMELVSVCVDHFSLPLYQEWQCQRMMVPLWP